jgi:uncharacterized protein
MPEYLSPGVYIEEIEGPQPIQPVGTSTGAFVGIAQFGPVNSPQLITNYTQFANTFGGFLNSNAYLAYAVQNFFNEGGTRCYVVRVFKADSTSPYPDAAKATLTAAGTGGATDPVLVNVYANSPGTWGNAVSVQVLADTFDPNNLPTAAVNAAGTGYKANDTLTLSGSGATITVNSVSASGAVSTFTLTAAGTGYPAATGLSVTGGSAGSGGATFNYSYTGTTPAVTLNTGGSGYKVNDVLTVVSPTDRTITVNTVSSSGGVLTFTLTSPGTGYPSATNLSATGGSGTGATFNYTFNPNQEFQIQVSETVAGSTVPTVVETYTHVSLIESDANNIPNQNNIEQRINNVSNYIIVNQVNPEPTTAPPAPQSVQLTGGGNGLPPGPAGTPGALWASDVIGAAATALVPASGLYAFDPVDDINIVSIPDLMLFPAQDARNATLQAITYCQNRGDCFYVADSPSGLKPQDVLDYKRGQNKYSGNAFNSKYAAIYYPWIYVADPTTGGTLLVPPSGAMVGRYSATDVNRGVFKAPAGTVDGYINSAMDIERVTTQGEQDTLNPEGINVIRKFADAGIVIWGARTVSSDTEWTYVPVRRFVIFLEQSILLGTQGIVFEPNDPALWKRIIRDVGAFLRLQWLGGALFGDTAAQAYFVKCDSETNQPETIAAGQVITVVGIAPVLPAEFVIFQIQLTSGSGTVSE